MMIAVAVPHISPAGDMVYSLLGQENFVSVPWHCWGRVGKQVLRAIPDLLNQNLLNKTHEGFVYTVKFESINV